MLLPCHELSRRKAALLGMALPSAAWAAAGRKKDRVDIATDKAAEYLLKSQERSGAFNDPNARQSARNGYAMTALGIMALASIGHQPVDPSPQGRAIKKALDFILRNDPQRGRLEYFGCDGSRMYGHGITTLCLTEMMGMGVTRAQESRLREVTEKALQLILVSQQQPKHDPRHRGGWRYMPKSQDSDLSVSVWQVMSLRSAKNSGLDVPKDAIDMAVRYLKRSYYSPRNARGLPTNLRSGCGYLPGQPPRYSTAAAGLLSLQVCGEYDTPEVRGSTNWLANKRVTPTEQWFYYGTYYYSQGMQKRPRPIAERARQITEDLLLKLQRADGSWSGMDGMERGAGRVYCTALATLSLSVKHHFLPIYQH
tara:strand:- start:745 stop:1845 length:1101 start_codon:yes stop_codon:yes gene_type:complete